MPTIEPTKYVDAPSKVLAGLEGHYTFQTIPEIPKLWGRFAEITDMVAGRVGDLAYGLCHQINESGIQYMAAVEIAEACCLPEVVTIQPLPACRYVVFTYVGPVSEISVTIDAIWHEWLPPSGKELIDAPHMLEVYGERFDPATVSGEVEIWIPIKT